MVTVPSSGAQIFLSSTHSLFFTPSTPHRHSETVSLPYPLLNSSSTVFVSDSLSHIIFTCSLSFVTLSSSHCHPHTFTPSSPHRRSKTVSPSHPLSYSSFTVSVSDRLSHTVFTLTLTQVVVVVVVVCVVVFVVVFVVIHSL